MKVKTLVKAASNSVMNKFSNEYKKEDNIFIDGCFVPLHKALQDKRQVDSFFVSYREVSDNGTCIKIDLNINTFYIKENTSDVLTEKKADNKKNKKKKKSKK